MQFGGMESGNSMNDDVQHVNIPQRQGKRLVGRYVHTNDNPDIQTSLEKHNIKTKYKITTEITTNQQE